MHDYNSLAKQALKGNYNSFNELVDHYKDGVYRTCTLLLDSEQEGLEAAEQVFIKAYRSLREADKEPLLLIWIYRLAVAHVSTLRKELERKGFWRQRATVRDPRPAFASLDSQEAQVLLLSEVEGLVPEDIAAILGRTVEDIRTMFSQARGSQQLPCPLDALKELKKIVAPPGFVSAIRQRLELEAGAIRKAASRRRSRSLTLGVAAASASLLAAWAVYQYIPRVPDQGQEKTSQLSSTPAPSVTEAPPAAPPPTAPSTTVPPPAPPAPPMPQSSLQARKEPQLKSLSVIVISNPRSDDSSPEKIFNSVFPPLKPPPARDGNAWVAELTDDQFWSMHKLLKGAYSKIRIPASAIPQGRTRTRIRLKFVPPIPAQKKADPVRDQASKGIETRSRLPIEDLLKE